MGVAPSVAAIMAVKAESGGRKRRQDTHSELPTVYHSSNSQEMTSQTPSAYFSGNSSGDCANKCFKPNNPSNNRPAINTTLFCENPNCEYPVGHIKSDCFVWGGGKPGSYPPNCQGQKDLHLDPKTRVERHCREARDKFSSPKPDKSSTGSTTDNGPS
jgi:hypothetical protein